MRALQLVLALAVSALMLWVAFRGTNWPATWTDIQAARIAPMLLAIVVSTAAFPARLPRWRRLLRREDGSALPTRALWHGIAIGFAANSTLPFRAGELLRPAAAARLGDVPFTTALSSIAVERVLDAIGVVTLLGLGLLTAQFPAAAHVGNAPARTGVIALVALVVAIAASRRPGAVLSMLRRMLPTGRFANRLMHIAENLLAGLGALRDPRHAIPVVAWTFVVWLVNAAAFWIGFRAFGIELPFSAALVMQGIIVFAIALPSTPGAFGPFEAAIVATLILFGIDKDRAAAYAIAFHITTLIPIVLLGAWSALVTGIGPGTTEAAAT
jgi:uncharacterized protein (TIRG00374 family)